jgi:NAD(P)-dependent dehydrogenase (short-subunit alcohol dehydrogenase family)
VNAVCPSAVQSRMVGAREQMLNPDIPEAVPAQFLARNPTSRYCLSEEVAEVVVFLASPAASLVNSVAMVVDGAVPLFSRHVQRPRHHRLPTRVQLIARWPVRHWFQ